MKASIIYLNETITDIIEAGFGVDTTKDVVSKTNKLSSIVENSVCQIDKQNLTHKIKVMKNIIKGIDIGLDNLTDIEKSIIVHRYIKNEYYYQFIGQICVSERTARRIKKEALFKMSFIIYGKE